MTRPPLRRHLLTAAAGLLACALATAAAIHTTPAWAKTLYLIAAATALSTAAKALWTPALPTPSVEPRRKARASSASAERSVLPPRARRRGG